MAQTFTRGLPVNGSDCGVIGNIGIDAERFFATREGTETWYPPSPGYDAYNIPITTTGSDYFVDGYQHILKNSYIASLGEGEHFIKLADIPVYKPPELGEETLHRYHWLWYLKVVNTPNALLPEGDYSFTFQGYVQIADTSEPYIAYYSPDLVVANWVMSGVTGAGMTGTSTTALGTNYSFPFDLLIIPVTGRAYESDYLNYYFALSINFFSYSETRQYEDEMVPRDMRIRYQTLNNNLYAYAYGMAVLDPVQLLSELGMFLEFADFSPEFGPASGEGGYGGDGFDQTSDNVLAPDLPDVGMSTTGCVNLYNPTTDDLIGFASNLIPQLTFSAPAQIGAEATVMAEIMEAFNSLTTWLGNVPDMINGSLKAKLLDFVIDCHLLPWPVDSSAREHIKVGWQTLTNTAKKCTHDYDVYYFGELHLREFYENFADYLTTARLFLPFVGFVSMQPEWFNNAIITLEYHYNLIDGSFMAMLFGIPMSSPPGRLKSRTLLGQWGGSACIHIPITGTNYASMMSGAIGAAAGAVSAAGSGNLAGTATSLINAISARPTVEQSNTYSASSSYLSSRTAFIQIYRPVSSFSERYQHEIGIPSNIYTEIGASNGFVRSDDVHLEGITCTDAERTMIQTALREGVIV